MSPRTETQFKEIRESRKSQIMDAALELFADQGYTHTSISNIAAKAKISKGLIYNYYRSKDELLQEIIFSFMDYILDVFDFNRDEIITKKEITEFINVSFDMIKKEARFWKLYFALLVQPTVFSMFQEKFMELIMPFMEILIKYYEANGSPNPEAEARLFAAMLDGVGFDYILDEKNYPLEDVKKLIIQKFV
jgi:AcrR family transcriptional regulator